MADHYNGNEIAIIGMAGRFPGAPNVEAFWKNLSEGVESIRFFTDEELVSANIDPSVFRDPLFIKAVAALDDADCWDAPFFNVTHREAEIMDPQHRVLLECAWQALENAGYDSETYEGAIGVFAGATINTYLLMNISSNPQLIRSLDDGQINIANGGDFLTTRISYKMNLRGPSHVVQCACSTSLVSVHVAGQSLLNQECDIALAGGVSVNVKHRYGYRYLPGAMASPDGHCRAFDERAEGTIFGSGVGIVVLKRLENALSDGDNIHAVIKGSAVNNDGSLKVGYTAPSVNGQAQVIAEALANAGIDAGTISYVEAHGTGTPLGDPIEIEALTKAFRASTDKRGYCAIGSVKTNIGHLDAAAGVAGLIKTVLALKHRKLPASLHFKRPNPDIDFLNSPFYVNVSLSEWSTCGAPRRAGISSFGVGGTNAHVIVEEPPQPVTSRDTRPQKLLLLSAATSTALEATTSNLIRWLKQDDQINLADVAYTLQVGRRRFRHRRAAVCSNVSEAIERLRSLDPQQAFTADEESTDRTVVFMFPGQGAQRVNMGLGLYQHEKEFRAEIEWCSELLAPEMGLKLRDVLYPTEEKRERAIELLNETWVTQPALFVIEYAMAEQWKRWGIKADAMIGHSIGEYVAACQAGVMSLEEAMRIVAARGRLIESLPRGTMIAVGLGEPELSPLLGGSLSLAAVNGPNQCVVSGPSEAMTELNDLLAKQGISCRPLNASHAFHSAMMEDISEEFEQVVGQVSLNAPRIPYVSNVSGAWIRPDEAVSPAYWARHLRETVRFHNGVRELLRRPEVVLLEVGPGETLTRLVRRHPEAAMRSNVLASFGPADSTESDSSLMLKNLGKLWAAGVAIDWHQFYRGERRLRVESPTYPFERQRYWIEPGQPAPFVQPSRGASEKTPDISDWFYLPSWKSSMPPGRFISGSLAENRRGWLLFVEENELSLRLISGLKSEGQKVVVVRRAKAFVKGKDRTYDIDPNQAADYQKLEEELHDAGEDIGAIVHLWSLIPDADTYAVAESFEVAQDRGFYSLVFLAQALGERRLAEAVRLMVVSNGVCSLDDHEALRPEKATILGPCRVIELEYPNVICRFVDIPAANSEAHNPQRIAEQLLSEISEKRTESIIAYRGSRRWAQSFEAVRLERAGAGLGLLREHGVYLITGGLTGLGLAVAELLGIDARARVAIVEESTFPKREYWERWLAAHDESDATSRRIKRARRLEDLGAEIFIINADRNHEQLIKIAARGTIARFGKLNGVFYVANFDTKESLRPIREMNRNVGRAQLDSTARHLYALREELRDTEIDFCILNSSLSSILGGLGAAPNSAASVFMDAFANGCNKKGQAIWMSINWDAWHFDDETEQLTTISNDVAQLAVTPEEGIEALRRILRMNRADQIIVSTADIQTGIKRRPKLSTDSNAKRDHIGDAKPTAHPRPQLRSAYAAPVNETERALAGIWQRTLGIEQIGTLDSFFELGGDSLMALQVIAEINRELRTEIPVVSLYEVLTIKSLAEAIDPQSNGNRSDAEDEVVNLEKAVRKRQYQQAQRSKKKDL